MLWPDNGCIAKMIVVNVKYCDFWGDKKSYAKVNGELEYAGRLQDGNAMPSKGRFRDLEERLLQTKHLSKIV